MNDAIGKLASKSAEDKRIVSLVKALEYLSRHHGVKFFDLHSSNVMERPSTGDLVVSDSGLFDMPLDMRLVSLIRGEKKND